LVSRGQLLPFDPGKDEIGRESTTDDVGPLTEAQERLLGRLHCTMDSYFPEQTNRGAREVVADAFRQADLTFGAKAAAAWAGDYKVPQDLIDRDMERLRQAGGSLVEMARRTREARRATRLNPERVRATLSVDNPEYASTMEFATTGVPLLLADSFRPSGVDGRPRLRPIVRETGMATTKMLVEGYVREDLAIVLSLEAARTVVEETHLSADSWATKQATESGRAVVDCKDGGSGSSLNCDQVYDEAVLRWQKIHNPSLDDIMCMILTFFDLATTINPSVLWTDLRIWKMDLKGAFTLLDFNPAGVPFLGTEVNGGWIIFYLVGLYGWTAMPMVFQIINRAIVWELSRPGVLKGLMNMYTDDLFGVCLKEDLEHDMAVAAALCRRLLGEKAIAVKKTESGTRLTLIGWDVDLAHVLVTIARRNALKAWYGYAQVELSPQIRVTLVQAWASWAERYGEICVWMRPFRRVMYQMIKGREKCKYTAVSAMGHRVVRLYQALLTLTLTTEGQFTRCFDSFRHSPGTLRITFDGSLLGAGIMWHYIRNGTQSLLGCAALSLRSLRLGGNPAYQNVCEYVTILLGLMIAVIMDWDTSAVEIIGDSKTALTWTQSGRFRSDNVINPATVCAALCATHVINIVDAQHIEAEHNKVTDTMSRRKVGETWEALMKRMQKRAPDEYNEIGVTPGQIPKEVQLQCLEVVLRMCDPRREFSGEKEFAEYWREVYSFVKTLSSLRDL